MIWEGLDSLLKELEAAGIHSLADLTKRMEQIKGGNMEDGKVHFYRAHDVLRPRGPMEKESVSLAISERLKSAFLDWTDESYVDKMLAAKAAVQILSNLQQEVSRAVDDFIEFTQPAIKRSLGAPQVGEGEPK